MGIGVIGTPREMSRHIVLLYMDGNDRRPLHIVREKVHVAEYRAVETANLATNPDLLTRKPKSGQPSQRKRGLKNRLNEWVDGYQ